MIDPAAATGVGSVPGTDSHEWSRTIAGELPDLPHVPELPARGPGADLVGRTAALLAEVAPDLAVETTPAGWRFADSPGRVMARARSWIAEDLDGIEEALTGRHGPVKEQLAGPWTLAAAIEMRNGERAVRDAGACRDIADALAEAASLHIAEIRRRLPAASVVLQLDEPSLPTVLAGGVATASGLATYRAVDEQRAQAHLGLVLEAIRRSEGLPAVHCCDARAPVALLTRAGAELVSIDLRVLQRSEEEALGQVVDAGHRAMLGVVPTLSTEAHGGRTVAERAAQLVLDQYARWGFPAETANPRVVLSPTCGLAGADPGGARAAYAAAREASRLLREDAEVPEETS